jgi:hypothetical protein
MELTVKVDELRKNKIFIATPMYGGQAHGLYIKSCLDLNGRLGSLGVESKFSFLFNESLVTRARNYLVDEFLRTDMTHILFIDSDICFDSEDVIALLALDKDIVGAPYPKKSINWSNVTTAVEKNQGNKNFNVGELDSVTGDYVFNPVPGTKEFKVTEPLEVMEIGTGMMLVKREVFEKFRNEYPHLKYKPDHVGQPNFDGSRYIHAYFDTVIDPDSERYLSEDYMFCQYWRAIGGSVWLCPWMKTQHVGTYAFQGNMPAIANLTGKL